MVLAEEQIKSIKEQILKQIDSWQSSEDKKQQAKKYIEELNGEQLEEFLKQNRLIQKQPHPASKKSITAKNEKQTNHCPFCLIAEGKIPAYKLSETKKSLAILEINPLSRGHSIIIPKEHEKIEKIPSEAFTLGKKITKRIKSKLKPESISMQTAEIFNHGAINIIPVYKDGKLEKKKASEDELKKLQEKLQIKPREKKPKKEKKPKILPQYPRRIP